MADDRMEQMLNDINERYNDDLFRLAMQYAAEKEGKLFVEEMKHREPECQPSQEQIKKFAKRLDTHLKRRMRASRSRHFARILNKAAVAMLALIVVFSVAMVTVDAFRVSVLNFLISIEPKYTSIQLDDKSDDLSNAQPIVDWNNAYVPTYIPAGYEIISVSNDNVNKNITFANTQDDSLFIIYSDYDSTTSIAVDTEDASTIEKIVINGQDGTYSEKNSIISIAWRMDDHLFTVQGNLSKDEAIKIANNVKFIK
jgi:hypothetical protein